MKFVTFRGELLTNSYVKCICSTEISREWTSEIFFVKKIFPGHTLHFVSDVERLKWNSYNFYSKICNKFWFLWNFLASFGQIHLSKSTYTTEVWKQQTSEEFLLKKNLSMSHVTCNEWHGKTVTTFLAILKKNSYLSVNKCTTMAMDLYFELHF